MHAQVLAQIAQLVERSHGKAKVRGSIPRLGSMIVEVKAPHVEGPWVSHVMNDGTFVTFNCLIVRYVTAGKMQWSDRPVFHWIHGQTVLIPPADRRLAS